MPTAGQIDHGAGRARARVAARPRTSPDARRERLAAGPALEAAVAACTACGLHRERTTPVLGEGPLDAALVVVASVPRAHEDLQGRPLAGAPRNVLDHALITVGVDPATVRTTSVVRCRPEDDRPPSEAELRACQRHLRAELELIAPRVVVSLGALAASVIAGRRLDLRRVAGYRLAVLDGSTTLVPTHHPADIVRGDGNAAGSLTRHLAVALAVVEGRLATGAQVRDEALRVSGRPPVPTGLAGS